MNSRSPIILACLVAAAVAMAQPPIDLVRKSMEARKVTLASLIQTQAMMTFGERTVMKIDFDGKGRSRRTVLQPLRMQGQVIIDDGRNLMTILADGRSMKTVASKPLANDLRLDLISKNYKLYVRKGETIAGRETQLVYCRPRNEGIPIRRLYIDATNDLPLRTVAFYQGKETVLLDTLSIEIPKSIPASLFVAPSGMHQIKVPSAVKAASEAEVSTLVTFSPWVPKNLPLGFAVESLELIGSGEGKVLAIRLTDGFNFATLYQWDAQFSAKIPGSTTVRNLRISLVGDIPEAICERLTEYLNKDLLSAWAPGT